MDTSPCGGITHLASQAIIVHGTYTELMVVVASALLSLVLGIIVIFPAGMITGLLAHPS
ncbi:hypothetical protein [Mangrovimicrobium sediminis]|uniref:hypothetical protein n=1 Tax=Mangrovimicrobium sediminis TaxID=2562682 RepID=UPI0014368679|nr:hypothetical protein [Haliea sp. SAOS-164]